MAVGRNAEHSAISWAAAAREASTRSCWAASSACWRASRTSIAVSGPTARNPMPSRADGWIRASSLSRSSPVRTLSSLSPRALASAATPACGSASIRR